MDSNELVRATYALKAIADHAEHDHDAVCVADALAFWFAQWCELLMDEGTITPETMREAVEVIKLDALYDASPDARPYDQEQDG